jgi:hypothetical protein
MFTINVSHGMPIHNAFGQVILYSTREAAEKALAKPKFAKKLAESIWKTGTVVEAHVKQ